MVVLWPKQEVLQFGILPFGKSERLPELSYSWSLLKKFISRAKSKEVGYYPRLKYSAWVNVAVNRLKITEEQAWLFFETFDTISDVDKESRTTVSDSLKRCATEDEKSQVKLNMSVNFLQFVIYLGMHLSDRPSLLLSPTDILNRSKWPLQMERSKLHGSDAHQMTVLNNSLHKLVDLLAEPGPGGGESEVSLECVQALGLLVGGADNDGLERPLHQLATLQAEIRETGYSKLTKMFKSAYLLSWLLIYLDKSPHGTSSLMGGARDRKCPSFRSSKRGKIMSNASLSPEGNHKLLFFHVTSQTVCKGEGPANGSSVEIQRCRNAYIYILAPLKFVTIEKCSNCFIFLGPVERMVSVESCDGVRVTTICRKLHIANTHKSRFHLHSPTRPVVQGVCSQLAMGPYNAHYPQLDRHLGQSMLDAGARNQWDHPIVAADELADPVWSRQAVEEYECFEVPFECGPGDTTANPVALPKAYQDELLARDRRLQTWSETLSKSELTSEKVSHLQDLVQDNFREWLESTGHDKEVAGLQMPEDQ